MTFEQAQINTISGAMEDSPTLFHMDMPGSTLPHDPKASQHEAAVVDAYRDSSPEGEAGEEAGAASNSATGTPLRGRTNRKRSNATQAYVCVVVWLVKPSESDKQGQWVWNEIQDVRRRYDQAYIRWTPHVTLIPPFVVPFNLSSATAARDEHSPVGQQGVKAEVGSEAGGDQTNVNQLADAVSVLKMLSKRIVNVCQRFTAQPVVFEQVSKFPLRRYDTYHLRPDAQAPGTHTLVQLQEALANALPEAIRFSRNAPFASKSRRRQSYHRSTTASSGITPVGLPGQGPPVESAMPLSPTSANAASSEMLFKPHLTLGQATQREKAEQIEQLAHDLVTRGRTSTGAQGEGPLSVSLDGIQLMFKPIEQSGPYDVFQTFSLRAPLIDEVQRS